MRGLSPGAVRSVFGTFESVNDELMFCVMDLPAGAKIPSVFKPIESPASEPLSALDQAIGALNTGDPAQAEKLLALASERKPDDPQIQYVARILEREKELRNATGPTETPKASRYEE